MGASKKGWAPSQTTKILKHTYILHRGCSPGSTGTAPGPELLCHRPVPHLLCPPLKAGSGGESKYPEKSVRLNVVENLILEQLKKEHGPALVSGICAKLSDFETEKLPIYILSDPRHGFPPDHAQFNIIAMLQVKPPMFNLYLTGISQHVSAWRVRCVTHLWDASPRACGRQRRLRTVPQFTSGAFHPLAVKPTGRGIKCIESAASLSCCRGDLLILQSVSLRLCTSPSPPA